MLRRPANVLVAIACIAMTLAPQASSAARARNGDGNQSGTPEIAVGFKTDAAWHPYPLYGGTVSALAVSPVDPNLVLVGMEEGETSGALYESGDAAVSWSRIDAPGPLHLTGYVYDLEFARDDLGYAATRTGLLVRAGSGAWTSLRSGPDEYWTEVCVNPLDPRDIRVGGWEAGRTRVLRSRDRGLTWSDVTPPVAAMNTTGLAISTENDPVFVAGFALDAGEIWRSADGGMSWTSPLSLPDSRITDVVHDGARFWASAEGAAGSGVYVSLDDAVTWHRFGDALPSRQIYDLAADPYHPRLVLVASRRGLHQCYGELWSLFLGETVRPLSAVCFVPDDPRRMLIGEETDGVLRSFDGGGTLEPASQGLLGLRIHHAAQNPANPLEINVVFQSAQSGGLFTSLDGGQTWELDPAFPVTMEALEYAPDGTLYTCAGQDMTRIRPEGVYRRGPDRVWRSVGPAGQQDRDDFSIACIRVNPLIPDTILMAGFDLPGRNMAIWRSGNRGSTWQRVFSDARRPGPDPLENVGDIQFVACASATGALAALSDGRVLQSADDGQSWLPVDALPADEPIQWLRGTPADPATLYAVPSRGGGAFVTHDGGATWSSFATDGFAAFIVDPFNADIVYGSLAESFTVVRSTNGGITFEPFADGAPATNVYDFAWTHGSCPTLLCATGAGLYGRAIDSVPPELSVDLEPAVLWPPDNRMRTIHVRVATSDGCDEQTPFVALSSITVEGGSGARDDVIADIGSSTLEFELRAARRGKEDRRYRVTYTATDASGNTRAATATVIVPHDQSPARRSGADGAGGGPAPRSTALVSIEPNPFNPSTRATVTLAVPEFVSLEVYDVRGARVRRLESRALPAGTYRIGWDGLDDAGNAVASGVYFFHFVAGTHVQTTKALLIK